MLKRLNFEQVPLEVVKKVVEEQLQQEVGRKRQEEKTTGSGPEIKRKDLERSKQLLSAGCKPSRNGRKS